MGDSGSNHNASCTWSDGKCMFKACQDYFPSAVRNINVQKKIINQFLNLYLGGKIQKPLSLCDVIFAAISIMPLDDYEETFIWPDEEYKDDGTLFFLSPEDMLNHDYKKVQQNISTNKDTKENAQYKVDRVEVIELAEESNNFSEEKISPDKHSPSEDNKQEDDKLVKIVGDNEINVLEGIIKESENSVITEKVDTRNESEESDLEKNIPTSSESTNTSNINESSDERFQQSEQENQFPAGIKWVIIRSNKENKQLNYGPVENAAFTKYCNQVLESWDTDKEARILLKSVFGFVALTLMRATAKSPKHLTNAFSSERFLKTLKEYFGNVTYSVPHKKCLKNCHRIISKGAGNIPILFAKIVLWSLQCKDQNEESVEIRSRIFKTAVLTHTSNYGMGVVNMLQTIQKKVQNEKFMNHVYNITNCGDTKDSWENVNAFMRQYMTDSSKHLTYYWARIIDNEEFKSLNCRNNFALAVILSVIIDNLDTNPGVWDSSWVKTADQEQLKHYKTVGNIFYTKLKLAMDKDSQELIHFSFDNIVKRKNFQDILKESVLQNLFENTSVEDDFGGDAYNIDLEDDFGGDEYDIDLQDDFGGDAYDIDLQDDFGGDAYDMFDL